jgi:hypothetical protein
MNSMTIWKFVTLTAVVNATLAVAQSPPSSPPPSPAILPIAQIRKSVAFLHLTCDADGKAWDVRGTGFFVAYPAPEIGPDQSFVYLATNRHVAMCWGHDNKPMHVSKVELMLNRREPGPKGLADEITVSSTGNIPWILPEDDSVDLAIIPMGPDQKVYDYLTVPLQMIMGRAAMSQSGVVEGERVFFAGFFYQFPGVTRMEPVVRQGIIAMIPNDPVPLIGKPEKLYLADMHAFGGNSGAPVFVNLGGVRGSQIIAGDNYHMIGVLNGGIFEDQEFNLELTSTIPGKASANSGVSTIVPADELLTLLESPSLKQRRDVVVRSKGKPQ